MARVYTTGLAVLSIITSGGVRAQSFSGPILIDLAARGGTSYDIYFYADVVAGGSAYSGAYASFGNIAGSSYSYLGEAGVGMQFSSIHRVGNQWIADSMTKWVFSNATGAYETTYAYNVPLPSSSWLEGKAAGGGFYQTVRGTISSDGIPANDPPVPAIAVAGHSSGDLVPAGTTITVYYGATDANSNLSGIRYNAWNVTTGIVDNGGGGYVVRFGGTGQVVKTFTLATPGDRYFWTEARDASGATASTASYAAGFKISAYANPTYCTPAYEPGYWNNNEDILYNNNCYNYANNKRTDTFAQPGRASGNKWVNINAAEVSAGAISDGLEPTDAGSTSPQGKTKIALVIAPGYDYHFYRQDRDGRWSHKIGPIPASNIDNSGAIITNPETADRWRYTEFVGYFFTPSDCAQGQGHANIY